MPLSIIDVAISAKEYARANIKKGSTQLETNNYPDVNQLSLMSGVYDMRDLIAHKLGFSSEEEAYELEIETINKYSLGNCSEMAKMALYYIITNYPQLYAQIYYIGNGDHVFLVLGNKKPALSMALDSWGPEAHVCDPWSNRIYPIAKWKETLRDYVYITRPLAKEEKMSQEDKYNYLQKNGLYLEKQIDRGSVSSFQIYSKKGETLGVTYFFSHNKTNTVIPLNSSKFIIPWEGYNSISLYQHGVIYRRAKIKSVLTLMRLFKDIFPDSRCLNQLLDERYLLQDGSLNEFLTFSELSRRDELMNQSVYLLRNFEKYLQALQDEPELQKKCILPISNQLQEIRTAIDCLNQLLKKEVLQNVELLNSTSIIDSEFSMAVKKILEKYPCSPSKEKVVEEAIVKAEGDIDAFIRYFYEDIKPTLQIRRNPNLDRVRGFFTLSTPIVKGAEISDQLEELINNYSAQLRPPI